MLIFSISVDREGTHTAAAGIDCVKQGQVRRVRKIAIRKHPVLAHILLSAHIQCHNFFRSKPYRKRTLRAIDPWVNLTV